MSKDVEEDLGKLRETIMKDLKVNELNFKYGS